MKPLRLIFVLASLVLASCGGNGGTPSPVSDSSSETSSSSVQSSSTTSSQTSVTSSEPSSESSSSSSQQSSSSEPEPVVTVQDTAILHAWNWSMENIKNELPNIKKAGYRTVQLSPMQPQKDFYRGYWSGQWWKLYQPYGFKVAGDNENVLGNKNQLKALTAEAKKQGIRIIVDVVTNHLAGGSENSFDGNVRNFEQEIYDNNLLHALGRYADDNDVESIVRGNIGGYPDLKTEDSRVQNRVISMCKEYIDCGISGFRFDAAKHIETDEDGNFSSDYWGNVVGAINSYSEQKLGEKAYIYGEILYSPGNNRSWGAYTKRMSTVDNKQGSAVLHAVAEKQAGNAYPGYTGCSADKLVLWAESHDTYANDSQETTHYSVYDINLTYAIQASRKDAAVLYFARPGNANMGDIGTSDYKSAIVSAANQFHNDFVGASESLANDSGVFVNVRRKGNKAGAMLINLNGAASGEVRVDLPNGEYKDILSKRSFTVSSGKVNASYTDGALMLENFEGGGDVSSLSITADKPVFKDSTNVTVSVGKGNGVYRINGGSPVTFVDSASFSVGSGLSDGEITIQVTASNGQNKSMKVTKTALADKSFVIYNVPDGENLLLWAWDYAPDSRWMELSSFKGVRAVDLNTHNYIIVRFPAGVTAETAGWGNKIAQTADLLFDGKLLQDYNDLTWK